MAKLWLTFCERSVAKAWIFPFRCGVEHTSAPRVANMVKKG
jgi:hypothetical protein